MSKLGEQCEHGQLKRSCDICELQQTITALTRRLERDAANWKILWQGAQEEIGEEKEMAYQLEQAQEQIAALTAPVRQPDQKGEGRMNLLNYGSLEACKKLYDVGIVLETDYYWYQDYDGTWKLSRDLDTFIRDRDYVPAPSMAEVWRELPEEFIDKAGVRWTVQLDKIKRYDGVVTSSAQYVCDDKVFGQVVETFHSNKNPIDALIELLIWVRKEKK